ncbi:VPLPA-CTERM sorting domain-containing protein [Rhodobacteraceae bacterium N5(2021)]|uniref:VPLPA-CTERM sorting domain-containing protein n=2 Tax=Gymnodinialimonas phycosphaerae TaxID=2841589 RepID=A0A975YI60_9RHOB|nr:VPLPA-CTERM sorting domain-containing protein [Gymnodinialimonas phycosphaerae]
MDFAELLPPDGPLDGFDNALDYCVELPENCDNAVYESYFGWIQITRGSVIPGLIGFSGNPNQTALVTAPSTVAAIPLPAGGLLLLAGLGGLVSLRRRAKA